MSAADRPHAAREVLRLTWPAVLTSFLQTAVFLADRLLLGRYGQEALASMQVQGPLLWSLFSVFGGLFVGTVPLVARAIGAGDHARAGEVSRASLRLALGLGLAVALVGVALTRPLVTALGPESAALRRLSESYLEIALLGFPQMFVATTAAMILGAAGDTRTPFLVGLLTNAVNVVANLVLIFGVAWGPIRIPAFGVAGSACGSVLAFTLEAVILIALLRRGRGKVTVPRLTGAAGAAGRGALGALARLSAPAILERVVIHAGFLAYVGVITRLGELAMASNQALVTLESVCFLSADGFGIAAATVVGQSLGRRDPTGARRAGWLATWLCVAALTGLGLAIWAAGSLLLGLFVPRGADGGALVAEGLRTLPLLALSQPFMAAAIVLAQALRGAGDTRSPLLSAAVGGLGVRVTLAWWLGLGLGLGVPGIWLASAVDWAIRTALLATIFARGRWKQIRV